MENVAKVPVDGIQFENMILKEVKGTPAESSKKCRELLLQGNKSDTLG